MEQNTYINIRANKELKADLRQYADSKHWKSCNAARVILQQFLDKIKKKRG